MPENEIKQVQLIIDKEDIMIKQYVAGIWEGRQDFSGFSYQTALYLDGVECFDVANKPHQCSLEKDHHTINVRLNHPVHPKEKYSYKLNFLLQSSTHLQKLGNLNILDWPKEDLTDIILLKSSGKLFFSSALAELKFHPKNNTRSIVPGKYAKSLTSHARNSSAIRIEWGKPPKYKLSFKYEIKNSSPSDVSDFKLNIYVPPSTKFQNSQLFLPSNGKKTVDDDLNWIISGAYANIPPKTSIVFEFHIIINPIGNTGIMLPFFGKWSDYQAITVQGSVGNGMIQSSKYWPTENPEIVKLKQALLNNAKNSSSFLKLAFEFVNQRIKYQINNKRADAAETLRSRKGDCSEMSDLLVCILRAAKIPAKIVHGWTIDLETHSLNPHAWCEFFSPRANGWRQCDPTWGYLTGVSCQHICRQREGLSPDQHTFTWSYLGDAKISVQEHINLTVIP